MLSLIISLVLLPTTVLSSHDTSDFLNGRLRHKRGGPTTIGRSKHAVDSYTVTKRTTPNWNYYGCWSDPSSKSPRLLSTRYISSSSTPVTPASCMSICYAGGYTYAGVENGQECWCGNGTNGGTLLGAPSCNVPCSGNASEDCGGSQVASVFDTTTPYTAPASTYLGCYQDSSTRSLSSASYTGFATLTNALCIGLCANGGYSYAGTEDGTQCFCGNSIAGVKQLSASSCATTCVGSSGTCGGGWALSVYGIGAAGSISSSTSSSPSTTTATTRTTTSISSTTTTITSTSSSSTLTSNSQSSTAPAGSALLGCYQDASTRTLNGPTTSTSSMTPAACMSWCASQGSYTYYGVEYYSQCYCGNTLTASTLPPSNCVAPCNGDSTQMCGGTNWEISVYQVTAPTTGSTPPPTGYTSMGCYQDQSARTLNGPNTVDATNMTPAFCATFCASKGSYTYFGVENDKECYCGNSLTVNTPLAASQCTAPCAGNSNQVCGGNNWQISLYEFSTTSTSTSVSSTITSTSISTTTTSAAPTGTPTVSAVLLGCYQDQSARTLSGPSTVSSTNMTPAFCRAFCASQGTYAYFGVEYHQECYCGNTMTTISLLPSSDCTATCTGDASQICGGLNWEVSVYQLVTSSPTTTAVSTSTASSSSTTTTAAPTPTLTPLGCYQDQAQRTLNGPSTTNSASMTVEYCRAFCVSQGSYTYFGVEYHQECYCGNTLSATLLSPSSCQAPCVGNSSETCGGTNWEISIWQVTTGTGSSTTISSASSTSTTTSGPTPAPTYDSTCNDNLVTYWGQNSYGATHLNDTANYQQPLSYYCHSGSSSDVFTLSFLNMFFGPGNEPEIDLANICSGSGTVFNGTDLANCQFMANDIEICQAAGKIVTLSLGGEGLAGTFTSDTQAEAFADQIWNLFLGGSSSSRPFGNAILDGINLDIESGTSSFTAFVNQLRSHYTGAPKKYYVTAAPQCPYPDASLGPTINSAFFDAVYVQFYNNPCGLAAYNDGSDLWNFAVWDYWAKNVSPNPNIKVFIGAPASSTAAGSDYVPISTLQTISQQTRQDFPSFGGVALWDASQATMNGNYGDATKAFLTSGGSCGNTFVPQACTAPAYNSASNYPGNQTVSYQGYQWVAKWWANPNESPNGGDDSNVWRALFECT